MGRRFGRGQVALSGGRSRSGIAGLVLAAGQSSRMGRPKATLEFGGRTFAGHGVELLRAAGCDPILLVAGAHPLDAPAGATVVHNPKWPLGPLASLQCGLRRALELAPASHALVVHHVERPRVRVETLVALLALLEREPGSLVQPSHQGRSGHPMIWPRELFDALLALDPEQETARTLVRGSAASRRRKLETDDPGVVDNIDTPADLQALLESC